MIYIQRVRNNDIGDDYGKQVELGKVFMSHHSWKTGEIPVKITFCSLSDAQQAFDGTKFRTTFKVRGDERGGDRIGVDCKEYINEDRVCVLKQFFTDRLHLKPNEDFFILEDIGTDGRTFKLYAVPKGEISASFILDKFKGTVIDMEEPDIDEEHIEIDQSLQLIYYGAPGTGKSHTIDKATNEKNSVRTTFHPDSDYAGFVGAYKPTMKHVPFSSVSEGKVKFAIPTINDEKRNHPGTEEKIVYKYVPQAFLKAYVEAWKRYADGNTEPYYLVIEEINRGNCAQIFGDLFQLLDRNNKGFSSYAITADEDIAQFLRKDENGFGSLSDDQKDAIADFKLEKDSGDIEYIGTSILDGTLLLLPNNLRIWATMNTSDQSLFPIDSAFKRRWNWEYVPINTNPVNSRTKEPLNWKFEIGGAKYYWGSFLDYINPKILDLTHSEDKQMGYFFAKPDKDGDTISDKVFVNKVLFYMWTDIFKDYDLTQEPFVYEVKDKDGKNVKRSYRFTDFFPIADSRKLVDFVVGMKLPLADDELASKEIIEATPTDETSKSKNKSMWTAFFDFVSTDTEFKSRFKNDRTPSDDSWMDFASGIPRVIINAQVIRTKDKVRITIAVVKGTSAAEKFDENKENLKALLQEKSGLTPYEKPTGKFDMVCVEFEHKDFDSTDASNPLFSSIARYMIVCKDAAIECLG